MQKTLLNIFKKVIFGLGVIDVLIVNAFVSSKIHDSILEYLFRQHWFGDILSQMNALIFPPLHHFEWNTLKPDNPFAWAVWNMIKCLVSFIPTLVPLFLITSIGVYAASKTLPTKADLLILPLNYIKATVFAYIFTHLSIYLIILFIYFGFLSEDLFITRDGTLYSYVFWLSIFFAWRQISLRDKPRKKFHFPVFPKVSPSPTL